MAQGVLYEIATGRIEQSMTQPIFEEGAFSDKPAYALLVEAGNSLLHYVDITQEEPIIVSKTPLVAEFDSLTLSILGNGFITLSPLPIETTVFLDQEPFPIGVDGVFEFETPFPGIYNVYVDHIKHFRKDWIINAS